MSVTVASGQAFCQSYHYKNSTSESLAIESNTSSYPRLDGICLCVNGASTKLVVEKGTPSATPSLAKTCSGNNYILLAQVYVGVGVSSIQASNITDLRFSTPGQYKITALDTLIHAAEDRINVLEAGKLKLWSNTIQNNNYIKIEKLSEFVDTGYKENNIYFYLNANYLKTTKVSGKNYSIVTLPYYFGIGSTYSVITSLSSSQSAILSGKFDGDVKFTSPTYSGLTLLIPNRNDEPHDCTIYIKVSGS